MRIIISLLETTSDRFLHRIISSGTSDTHAPNIYSHHHFIRFNIKIGFQWNLFDYVYSLQIQLHKIQCMTFFPIRNFSRSERHKNGINPIHITLFSLLIPLSLSSCTIVQMKLHFHHTLIINRVIVTKNSFQTKVSFTSLGLYFNTRIRSYFFNLKTNLQTFIEWFSISSRFVLCRIAHTVQRVETSVMVVSATNGLIDKTPNDGTYSVESFTTTAYWKHFN